MQESNKHVLKTLKWNFVMWTIAAAAKTSIGSITNRRVCKYEMWFFFLFVWWKTSRTTLNPIDERKHAHPYYVCQITIILFEASENPTQRQTKVMCIHKNFDMPRTTQCTHIIFVLHCSRYCCHFSPKLMLMPIHWLFFYKKNTPFFCSKIDRKANTYCSTHGSSRRKYKDGKIQFWLHFVYFVGV